MGGRNYNHGMGGEFAANRRVRSDAAEYRGLTDDMAVGGLGELFARRLIEISGRDDDRYVELDDKEHR